MISRDIMQWQDLGRVPYREAWAMQEELRVARAGRGIQDRLLLLEHDPVITLGRRGCPEDVLSSEEELAAAGIEVVATNRGGRATYHGPGQLVGYLICELAGFGVGVRAFVHSIEEVLIRALAGFGVEAGRDENYPGLWVGRDKIVAVGLNISHGITQHGFALGVSCDLDAYRHLVACGISDRGITTMERVTGRAHRMDEIKAAVAEAAGAVLGRGMIRLSQASRR